MGQDADFFGVSPGANAAGTIFVLQAPATTTGGGITVDDITIVNSAAGTISYTFLKYSNAATPALNGTVATTGGTLAAGVPLAATIGPNNWLDAGEVLKVAWTGAGTPAADARIYGHYRSGRASV